MAETQFVQRLPDCQWFCEALTSVFRDHPETVLAGILELADIYPGEAMRAAFRRVHSCQTYSAAFLRGVLQTEPHSGCNRPGTSSPRDHSPLLWT